MKSHTSLLVDVCVCICCQWPFSRSLTPTWEPAVWPTLGDTLGVPPIFLRHYHFSAYLWNFHYQRMHFFAWGLSFDTLLPKWELIALIHPHSHLKPSTNDWLDLLYKYPAPSPLEWNTSDYFPVTYSGSWFDNTPFSWFPALLHPTPLFPSGVPSSLQYSLLASPCLMVCF